MKKIFLLAVVFIFITNATSAQSQPYVILISFDGFRWDYPDRGLSPNIELMKENGVAASSLRPCFPSKTFPNHYAIVTGMYPENNGLIANSMYDPYHHRKYALSDSVAVKDGRWYLGEAFWETAERNGITTASYFWPGSEMNPAYRRPTYFEHYDHAKPLQDRVEGIIHWLTLPLNQRPHFLTLYMERTDDNGHHYGPESKEVNEAIRLQDNMLGLLFSELKRINLFDSTNIILVSDHGMSGVSKTRMVNIEKILEDYKVHYQQGGPIMFIQPKADEVEEVYNRLLKKEEHYNVYTKENIPARFHFSKNPFIPEIILSADLGWSLTTNSSEKYMMSMADGATHGWDNNLMDMQGIFFAMGPAFKKGYQVATVNNIDIYPLLCKIFNISPRSNVDGKLENIEYVLKGR